MIIFKQDKLHSIKVIFIIIFILRCGISKGDSLNVWTAESNQPAAKFGCSVSSAGDVNGDGYDDAIITSAYYDNGETDEGRVFVYYGSANGLSTTADWTAESNQVNANCYSGTGAGDVNGDGYDDVIVGAHLYDNGQTDEGKVFVYYGSAKGLSDSADWSAEGNQAGGVFGISVSTAGDVNGDGYSDIIIGAYLFDNGETDEGKVFVYYGSASGLSDSPDWTAETNQAYSYLGLSVSTAGDVNGDGYSDIITGAQYFDNGQTDEGRVYIYYGSPSGLSSFANWTAESNQANALFGYSVSTAGDVNGDGYSDVIVGSYLYDNGQTDEGRAYLYYGSNTGPSLVPDWTAESDQAMARFGIAVSTAGDVNGDGYSDIIVGAYRYDNPLTDEGRAYLYLGSENGVSETADWTGESNQANARYGYFVSTAGDVNNDGNSEIIIGAVNYDNGELDEGRAFLYYGSGFRTLHLTALIQGFYKPDNDSMVPDTVSVFLRKSLSPYTIVDSSKAVLNENGNCDLIFSKASNGESYYLDMRNRNSIPTWSSLPVKFYFGELNYDFSNDSSKAFGNNQKRIDLFPDAFGIFGGDIDQNGVVQLSDIIKTYNDASEFISGYSITDLDGNDLVNLFDIIIVFNNSADFVQLKRPYSGLVK